MIINCDFCRIALDTQKDRWQYQDDGSYIHIDCIEPALNEYKAMLDKLVPTSIEVEFKLASKIDPREPFIENWRETCEWCGYVVMSPNETHACKELI